MNESNNNNDTGDDGAKLPRVQIVDMTPGGGRAERGLLEMLLAGKLGVPEFTTFDGLTGDELAGDAIETEGARIAVADVQTVKDFLAESNWKPEVGDILEVLPRGTHFLKYPKAGEQVIVTRLIEPMQFPVSEKLRATPFEAMPSTVALGFMSHPNQDETKPRVFVEHLYDHRLFKRVGNIFKTE